MNKNKEIDLQLISSIIFLITVIISISVTYDEKLSINNKKGLYTTKQALDISFYNRIIVLISIFI